MRIWPAITAILLAGLCVANLAFSVRRTPPSPHGPETAPRDIVLRLEQRLAPLRVALDRHGVRGTIGYLTDVPPEALTANDAAMRDYFVSQFVLVPRVLDARPGGWQWAVTNFSTNAAVAQRIPPALRVVEDLGGGVALLQKVSP